jgi:DNA-binding NtrC family response regulator
LTSPIDTTLHERAERPRRVAQHLTAVCAAGEILHPQLTFAVPESPFEIGRAAGPVSLGLAQDPHLSRRHAAIERAADGSLTIRALGSAPVSVNGADVRHAVLANGDAIVLGQSALILRDASGPRDAPPIEGLVGDSPAMRAIRRSIAKVSSAPVSVVLLGESGSGKEVVARALHARSGRGGDFLAQNCAAIPASLAEAQLFGHSAGAFTGAQRGSAGVFRAASGGTLFLDEIGDLPLEVQPKLLRVLEERTVVALGGTSTTPVDVRVVAATNRDLIDDVRAGRFRGDLYARLAEFTIELPPLRERREDILPILMHLAGDVPLRLGFEALHALLVHPWPFNVRELRTIVAQLRLLAPSEGETFPFEAIAQRLLDTARAMGPAVAAPSSGPSSSRPSPSGEPKSESVAPPDAEGPPTRVELEAMLAEHRGNVTELARAKGRSRRQVYRWLDAHGLDPVLFRSE